jgi:S-formylglutathione hydrolase FrmB
MKNISAVITLLCATCIGTASFAQPACVKGNAGLPPNANTTDRAAPFFVDTTGLDFKTAPPTRNPLSPHYPPATELADGTLPPAGVEGNFIIGPTHKAAPETVARDGVPHGRIVSFKLASQDSVIFNPGIVRDDPPDCRNGSVYAASTMPGDRSHLVISTSHPGTWTRSVDVYVPAQYVAGSEAPFIVFGDGGGDGSYAGRDLFTVLDNMIHEGRLPAMIAIGIGAGGQDSLGSERGREYDTVSGAYAQFVEREVLPLAEKNAGVRLTKDPDGRATMGISSSGAAAFTMAWFNPDLYRRVLAYSPTMVNHQWPQVPWLRGGAWEYHGTWAGAAGAHLNVTLGVVTPSQQPAATPLILSSPVKPIRFWFEVGDRDLFYTSSAMADGMHDWVLASTGMARVLKEKGYHYQFVFARNAGHVDRPTVAQTLPHALEWLWKGYAGR